ncbi:hypothetical protein TVAG_239920 [Trichomonas vaginalis G3]|uniref:Survival motor neuron Tudor domain-containing protein n=1 Tax=Trichomonas vaginalis (strain ATCC PRA-98 / G3) TaxID=412133 RepID=A2EFD5_TRIV3|nr:hypothetical protein TVAGG3_0430910 [Trichomonas vaginalis G3]EAY08632.1 hypothetical protein TVAG_239920 [Trichomonas vaginalis G3]KAI5536745.1 hypothetical protein TVAGG3_0430910 [Trichomonas vaginalis G3]|eukprot:XP_001320855.1 hypothetical protein [Trichomonas vaginalis G3]
MDPIADPSNIKLYLPKTDNAIVDAFEMAVSSFQVSSKIEGAKFFIPTNAEILNSNNSKVEETSNSANQKETPLDEPKNLPKFNILDKRPIDKPIQNQEPKSRPVLKEKPIQKENKTEKANIKSNDKQQHSKPNKVNENEDKDMSDSAKLTRPNPIYVSLPNAFPPEPPSMMAQSTSNAVTFPPPIPIDNDPIRNHMLHAWYWAGYYTGLADARRNQNNVLPK